MEQQFAFLRQGKGLDSFWLKIIAIVGMTMNHTAHVFSGMIPQPWAEILYAAGGVTFPIMACLMAVGYAKTSNLKRYMLRLLVFALISLLPFMYALHAPALNVLFTLLLGLCAMWMYDHIQPRAVFWVLFVLMEFASIFMDWPIFGPLLMILLHIFLKKGKGFTIPLLLGLVPMVLFMAATAAFSYLQGFGALGLSDIFFTLVSLCVIPLMKLYNGQQGIRLKYLFYIYYPLHLTVLVLVHWLITGAAPYIFAWVQ